MLAIQINEETIKMHGEQLGTALSDKLQKNLTSDLKNLAVSIWRCHQIFFLLGKSKSSPMYIISWLQIIISITRFFLLHIRFKITSLITILFLFLLQMTFKNTAYTEGFQDGLQSVKIKLKDLFE